MPIVPSVHDFLVVFDFWLFLDKKRWRCFVSRFFVQSSGISFDHAFASSGQASSTLPLIDRHSARNLWFDILQIDGIEVRVLFNVPRRLSEVVLQAGTKVAHADDAVGDGANNEDNGDDSKGSERFTHRPVLLFRVWLVNPDELVEEVGKAAEVADNDDGHADLILDPGEPGSQKQNGNSNGDGGDGKTEFGVGFERNNNQKLNSEAEEKEEVELQKCDINLVVQETLLHPVVGSYSLKNVPSKDLVELPGSEGHGNGTKAQDAGDGDQVRFYVDPHVVLRVLERAVVPQLTQRLFDLFDLDGSVNHQCEVGNAHANNLNGVLRSQRVPDNNQLVQEAEDEKRQECRDYPPWRVGIGVCRFLGILIGQACLEFPEDVALEGQTDYGLDESDEEEDPWPLDTHEAEAEGATRTATGT